MPCGFPQGTVFNETHVGIPRWDRDSDVLRALWQNVISDVRRPFATMQWMIAEATTVTVNLPDQHYNITIRPGLLSAVGPALLELGCPKKVGIITDSQVGPLYADTLIRSLRESGIEPLAATIPAGETHKTLADLSPVYDLFLSHRVEQQPRSSPSAAA